MPSPIITAEDIALFRAEAEAMMQDTCRITITDPDAAAAVFNNTTGQYSARARVTLYEGKCRFQIKADINSNIVETTAGEREWTYTTLLLELPVVGAGEIPPDATVESLVAPHNPHLAGRIFNIQGEIGHKSQPVIRRFRLREVVA